MLCVTEGHSGQAAGFHVFISLDDLVLSGRKESFRSMGLK